MQDNGNKTLSSFAPLLALTCQPHRGRRTSRPDCRSTMTTTPFKAYVKLCVFCFSLNHNLTILHRSDCNMITFSQMGSLTLLSLQQDLQQIQESSKHQSFEYPEPEFNAQFELKCTINRLSQHDSVYEKGMQLLRINVSERKSKENFNEVQIFLSKQKHIKKQSLLHRKICNFVVILAIHSALFCF